MEQNSGSVGVRDCPVAVPIDSELPCPITVYGGLQDQDISLESLRAWEEQTSADCKLRTFPGDHFFIYNPGAGFVEAFRGDVLNTLRYPVRAV